MKHNLQKAVYFPGLNGIRAIASIAVVISHITLALPADFHLSGDLLGPTNLNGTRAYFLGPYGVTMFFVLSGFLITYLMQTEAEKQEINVKKFYFRRILRIWPLYYLYLALCIAAILIGKLPITLNSTLWYVFFAANIPAIFGFSLPFLSHLWSIGVEEQFYLFWPWVVKKVKNNLIPLIIILIIVQNVIRIALWYYYPKSIATTFSIMNRFDSMMIGALGAILFKKGSYIFIAIFDNKLAQALALSILGLLVFNRFSPIPLIDNLVVALVTLTIIIGQINKKNRLLSFENKVLDFLGKISFGIYVYHPLLIFLLAKIVGKVPGESPGKYVLVYGSVLLATILLAYLSYTYFESWFIKLKRSFAVVKSTAVREPAEVLPLAQPKAEHVE